MKSLSKNHELSKSPFTEFDDIVQLSDVAPLTIDVLESAAKSITAVQNGQQMKDLLEQKAILAIEPYVLTILQENKVDLNLQHQNIEQINSILQKIVSPMSARTTCYFRAGKAYLRINHEMGYIGNLFFKSLFYNILKNSGKPYHMQTRENTVCIICRI